MSFTRSRALGGIDVLRSEEQHFSFAPHRHDEVVIAVYMGGRKHFRCHRSEGFASRGDVLMIGSDVVHEASSVGDAAWNYLSIYVTHEQISLATGQEPAEVSTRIGSHRFFSSRSRGARFGQQMLVAVQDSDEGNHDFALEVLLSDLLSACRASRNEFPNDQPALEQIAAQLREEPNRKVTLKELSDQLGVSPEHFSRTFKAHFGLTPFQMLIASRTEHARRLIRQHNSLAEAAYSAGFADQSHMTRWFKRIYGATPGQFAVHQ